MKRFLCFSIMCFLMALLIPVWAPAQAPPPPPDPAFAPPPPPDPPFASGPDHHRMGPRWGMRGPGGFGMGGHGMGPGFGRLQEELGLTEEQRAKLRQQFLESRKAAVRTQADLTIKQMELHELMEGDNPDRAQIDRKLREIADLRYAMQKSHVDGRLAFQQVLTPEQRAKLRQFRERGFRGGPGGWGGPGRPQGPVPDMRPRRPAPPQL